jgi:hypothetical protein
MLESPTINVSSAQASAQAPASDVDDCSQNNAIEYQNRRLKTVPAGFIAW